MSNRQVRVVLLEEKIDDEVTSQGFDCSGLAHIALALMGHGTTSGGTITYEEAVDDPSTSDTIYGGTWSIIGSANNASDVTGNKQKVTHLTVGAYGRIRARISDAITGGGSISVVLIAKP